MLSRKASAAAGAGARRPASRLEGLVAALAAHDPERVLERGYAVVDDGEGGVVSTAEAARAAGRVRLFFADGAVRARIEE